MSFLPGHFPGGAAAEGAPVLTELTQVGSNTSNGATITAPATVNPGDLLVLWQVSITIGSAPALVQPTDFVTISNTTISTGGVGIRFNFCYKIAVGTEDGATLTGMDGGLEDDKLLYQFRGDIPITAVGVGDLEDTETDGNPGAHTVSASAGVAPLIVLAGYSSSAAIDPRTFTQGGSAAKDGEITGAGSDNYLAYKIFNSSPADIVIDMDDEGNGNGMHSFYLACS